MELILGSAGLWASFGVGVVLLTPIILEFGKRNLPLLFGIVAFVFVLRGLSTQSPEMQTLWLQLQQIPHLIYTGIRNI